MDQIDAVQKALEISKDDFTILKQTSDSSLKELKEKNDLLERKQEKLKSEIRYLRAYMEENEKRKKNYFVLKRDKMREVKEMHSMEEDFSVLSKLHEQMEMLENRRIEDYAALMHQTKEVEVC